MDETTKSSKRRSNEEFFERFIQGEGIDIGCGKDKIADSAIGFDLDSGDAQKMEGIEPESFDYVYSSHCLEHMRDPLEAILNWWRILKPGGYLIVAVPDEDLYEQGISPSLFNPDHKVTFTISKEKSWSPTSTNLVDLIRHLPHRKVIYIKTIDLGYDHSKIGTNEDQTMRDAEAGIELVVQKVDNELTLRTALSQLMKCPKCQRLELTVLGLEKNGSILVRCRSCGSPASLKQPKDI